ncbi:type VI secretion system secreted protein VgrG [Janthinobacterium sp. CG_23.3]|uniref:type VI secretion system Vgr family protein n=1 Tax=Janthinobacterium sp. CG_23.3 TaxID=3349634 RepID=UPI0038D4FE39
MEAEERIADPARSLTDLVRARQNNRILRLSFPHNDGPRCEFVVNKLDALESMSRDFEYTIEILSDNEALAPKDIQGKLFSVQLVQAGGTLRYFSGYCFAFRRVRAGGITFYEAKLGPWLKYLTLRTDNYLFHDATVYQQSASIFADYAAHAVWQFSVGGIDAPMTDACQFNETDSNYLHRRWEAAGIHYHYEHDEKGHTLVLSDDSRAAAPIDGDAAIMFHRHAGAREEDAIGEWSPGRRIEPAGVALTGFNFKNPVPLEMGVPTIAAQGTVLDVESYEYAGAYGFKNRADGDRLARLRMEEREATGEHVDASGNNRRVQPGRWFSLTDRLGGYPFGDQPDRGENAFLILSVHHVASNNYLQDAEQRPHYSNRLRCVRKALPWRPGRNFNSVDTRILAPQTATVVGPEGQGSLFTDEYGRVRVQFHWDRVGGHDEASSAWIRAATSWAGNQLGASALPRVGSEVMVMWLDGCPDRPLVTGAVHNARYMPPWALPDQQALMGLRSRELTPAGGNAAGGRSNHLILDDSNGQIQAQLKSDHQHSQLSLGHVTRVEGNAGRMDARGEGWELASDAWGVARAGRGMLITTEARPAAQSYIKDMGETVQRLRQARARHKALAEAAQERGAQEASGQQADVAAVIDAQNEAVAGAGAKGAFPELAAPLLVLASPAGIATTTGQSTHIASAEHTAVTSGKSLSIAAGDGFFASVGRTFRLFVHKAGMKLVAAAGKVTIEAQSDDIEVIANKVLELISQTDWVDIRGKKGVRLHGANHMLEIGEKVQFFSSSPVLFHGNLETLGPKSVSQSFNERPGSRYDQEVRMLQVDNKPAPHVEYELLREDGNLISGKTGAAGSTELQKGTGMDSYTIRYKGELP